MLNFNKIKNFYSSKDNISKVKRQATDQIEVFAIKRSYIQKYKKLQ